MVSFQCEGCGDTQTKKKLDSHWNRCRAPFTCIDCMTTFYGYDYQQHTSCITEDQKYQGHLYKDPKANKAQKRKSVQILEPHEQNAIVSQKAHVRDVQDGIPPPAPTPPQRYRQPAVSDDVFAYMVEEPNNTPKITFAEEREEMKVRPSAPSIFSPSEHSYKNKEEQLHSDGYDNNGYTYGAEPVKPRPLSMNESTATLDYMTPAAKVAKAKLDNRAPDSMSHSRNNSNSEKKRKRAQTDDSSGDSIMTGMEAPSTIIRSVVDTPAKIAHSGLTGGLQRMLSDDTNGFRFPRSRSTSPIEKDQALAKLKTNKNRESKHIQYENDPQSPLKKTRRSKEADGSNGLGISIKGRAGKVMSVISDTFSGDTLSDLRGDRERRNSDENSGSQVRGRESERREHKKHKVARHNGTSRDNVRVDFTTRTKSGSKRHDSESPDLARSRKSGKSHRAIEYHDDNRYNSRVREPHTKHNHDDNRDRQARDGSFSHSDDSHSHARTAAKGELVVFGAEDATRTKCKDLLDYISKGPDSTKGYSMNKVLKRYHKDSQIHKKEDQRAEEVDLWKGLRMKKNDRGEVVLFC